MGVSITRPISLRIAKTRSQSVRKAAWLAVAAAVGILPSQATSAATLTFDSSGASPATPVDGSGTWDTNVANTVWSNGATDVAWNNSGQNGSNPDTAVIGANNGAAGTITLGTNITTGGLTFNQPGSGSYTVATGANTLTISGNVLVGLVTPLTGTTTTSASVTGNEMDVSGAASLFQVALGATVTTQAGQTTDTLDLSGLSTFTFNNTATGTGELDIGIQNHATGTLKLAANSTITTKIVRIGDSTVSGANVNGGSGTSVLSLGSGSNIINAGTITVGNSKANGMINFAGPNGSLMIRGQDGVSAATINLVPTSSGTGQPNGTMSLTGHNVDILGSTLTMGNHSSANGANTSGTFSFDQGSVNVQTISMSHTGGTSGTAGTTTSILTVGGDASHTATLTVNSGGATGNQFVLANDQSSGGVDTAIGTLDIKTGGVVNSNTPITEAAGGSNTTANVTATVLLEGGTLDMMAHAVGGTSPVTLTTTSGTIQNVSSINGVTSTTSAANGITMATAGKTLTIGGTDGYTGPTSVTAGTLLVNGVISNTTSGNGAVTAAAGTVLGGTGTMHGSAAVSGTLSPGATASNSIGAIHFSSTDPTAALDLSGGTYLWELGSLKDDATGTAGTDFDQIDLTGAGGNLKLGGTSALTLSFINAINDPNSSDPFWTSTHSWTVIAGTGATNTGSTQFASITDPTWNDGTFSSSADSLGNVILTFTPSNAVPEPATAGLLLAGGVMLLGRRRRIA